MSNSILNINAIPEELLNVNRVIVTGGLYSNIVQNAQDLSRLRTPYPAKTLNEVYGLVKNAISNMENRENIAEEKRIIYTEEDPDYQKENAVHIVFSLIKREPGAYGSGSPTKASVTRNYAYALREEISDPENPGYKRAILGFMHDNEIKFTIFAKTNKVANERALWFEGLMQEYSWYFTSQGVPRFLFLKREADFVTEVQGQKWYGRPIHYYVRTETLRTISQKELEQILVGPAKEPIPSQLKGR